MATRWGTEVEACKGTRLASATCTERVDGPHATVSIQLIPIHCHMMTHSTVSSKFKTATCDTDTSLRVHTDCSEYLQQRLTWEPEWPWNYVIELDIPNLESWGSAWCVKKVCSWKREFLVLAVTMAESTAKLSPEVEDLSSSSEDEHIGRGVFNTVATRR